MPSSEADGLLELVQRARAGDRVAFDQLIRQYHGLVLRIVLATFPGCGDDLREIVQNVWLAAWRGLPQLRELSKFRAWLVGIATRKARNAARRQGGRVRVVSLEQLTAGAPDAPNGLDAAAGAVMDPPSDPYLRQWAIAALLRLPEMHRKVFYLKVLADPPHDFPDIARLLDRKEVTVRVWFCRACKRLREMWPDETP